MEKRMSERHQPLNLVVVDSDLESAADGMRIVAQDCREQAAAATDENTRRLFESSANRWQATADRIESVLNGRFESGKEVIR